MGIRDWARGGASFAWSRSENRGRNSSPFSFLISLGGKSSGSFFCTGVTGSRKTARTIWRVTACWVSLVLF